MNPGYGNGLFGNDLNDWKRLGTFATIGNNPDPVTQNAPPETDGWGIATVLSANNTKIAPTIQLFNPLNNIAGGVRPLFYRFFRDTWTEWKPVVIAASPQEYDLPLESGVSPSADHGGYKNTYCKNQFGEVSIFIGVSGEFTNGRHIFTLPEGYRPNGNIAIPCYISRVGAGESNQLPAFIRISATGEGFIYNPIGASAQYIYSSGEFATFD